MEDNQQNLQLLLDACQKGKRSAQKKVYYLFYGYTYSIGLRYGENRAEAEEIVNESFLKVFTKLDQYDRKYPFKQWLRKIVVNTAIDYHRKYKKLKLYTSDEPPILAGEDNEGWNNLLYEDVLREVQKLSPAYRLVFNLHVIEGLKHHEIAERLNINVGTSKSNYSKARKILQTALKQKPLAKNYRDVR